MTMPPGTADSAFLAKAEFFKALGHPARIRILHTLRDGELSVSGIQAVVGLEQSHLSQQLGVLRRAGLVAARRDGNSVRYAVRDPRLFQVLHTAREVVASTLSSSDAVAAALLDLDYDGFSGR